MRWMGTFGATLHCMHLATLRPACTAAPCISSRPIAASAAALHQIECAPCITSYTATQAGAWALCGTRLCMARKARAHIKHSVSRGVSNTQAICCAGSTHH